MIKAPLNLAMLGDPEAAQFCDLLSLAETFAPLTDDGCNQTPYGVAYDGNSMTAGYQVDAEDSFPAQTTVLLSDDVAAGELIGNYGVNSQTTAMMIADADTQIDPEVTDGAVIMVWEGTNDLYFGATAQESYALLRQYCQERVAAGWRVVVGTILPRSNGGTPGTFEASRQTLNGLIRDSYTTFANGVADFAGDSRIGNDGDEANTTYYQDRVHMTAAGYAICAEIAAQKIVAAHFDNLVLLAPTADAGPDQSVGIISGDNVDVTLDGSGSTDLDGTIANYTWTGTPNPADTISPTINLTEGTHIFTLVVTDNNGLSSAADTVTITVTEALVEQFIGPPMAHQASAAGSQSNTMGYNMEWPLPTGLLTGLQILNQITGESFPTAGKPMNFFILRPTGTPSQYTVVYTTGPLTVPVVASEEITTWDVSDFPIVSGDILCWRGNGAPYTLPSSGSLDKFTFPANSTPVIDTNITLGSAPYVFYASTIRYSVRARVEA